LVDLNTRCFFAQYLASQWVSIRLDVLGALVILGATLLPVISTHTGARVSLGLVGLAISNPSPKPSPTPSPNPNPNPEQVGLAISNSLEVCQFLKHATRMTLELEKSFSGVERLVEYAESLPREPSDGAPLPALNWPTAGEIGHITNPSPNPNPNPNPDPNPNPNP
jgi:hypothetical protein